MTLLEALVALVILGLTATGFLQTFRAAGQAGRDAAEWSRAVAAAEATMEGAAPADSLAPYRPVVATRAWGRGLDEVAVTVTVPSNGARFTVRRLVRR